MKFSLLYSSSRASRFLAAGVALFSLTLLVPLVCKADGYSGPDLWKLDNLYPWCMVPYDGLHRGPEARAALIEKLGFKQFVYDWREINVPEFDTEIEALQKHNIKLLGWWFPGSAADPHAKIILDAFKRHDVHPQLWVVAGGDWTHSPDEQTDRVNQVADRINALVKFAQPYGCTVELYNHNGWSGSEDNELAIIARLKELGTTSVGMVYNFSHAHDGDHNDITDFPAIWARIQSHVVAVNVSGMGDVWQNEIWPSQGNHEVAMMKTIQDSGWSGPVGIICENGGGKVDAEVNLTSELKGLAWCAAEIQQPGSGGPRPFPLP